jgi:type VI secretion system secreted protein Hcp
MNHIWKNTAVHVSRHVLIPALALGATIGASSATAAIDDIFLRVDGIPGESKDAAHPDEIVVLGWSWGANGPTGAVGKKTGCPKPLAITKFVDKATTKLTEAAVQGSPIPSATLTLRKAGGDPKSAFLVLTLSDVLVTSSSSGAPTLNDVPTEEVTFVYGAIKVVYTPQNPDGSAGTATSAALPASCP